MVSDYCEEEHSAGTSSVPRQWLKWLVRCGLGLMNVVLYGQSVLTAACFMTSTDWLCLGDDRFDRLRRGAVAFVADVMLLYLFDSFMLFPAC